MITTEPCLWHDAAVDYHAAINRHPIEDIEPKKQRDDSWQVIALRDFFRILGTSKMGLVSLREIGLRAAAALYLVRPDLLDGMNQREFARHLRVSPEVFCQHVQSLAHKTHFRSAVLNQRRKHRAARQL